MLDAIFQFTDFEAFHGADLDPQVVCQHRQKQRKATEQDKNLTKQK